MIIGPMQIWLNFLMKVGEIVNFVEFPADETFLEAWAAYARTNNVKKEKIDFIFIPASKKELLLQGKFKNYFDPSDKKEDDLNGYLGRLLGMDVISDSHIALSECDGPEGTLIREDTNDMVRVYLNN